VQRKPKLRLIIGLEALLPCMHQIPIYSMGGEKNKGLQRARALPVQSARTVDANASFRTMHDAFL
jgi:hypothetical protein